MQRALCNLTADADEHTHICNFEKGHKGEVHMCSCGTIFISVKEKDLEAELKKTVQ